MTSQTSAAAVEIPLLAGDGVGPELADAARLCVDALNRSEGETLSLVDYPVGYAAYRNVGNALPPETLEAMRGARATLLAAISTSQCPPPSPMGQIRQQLGLYADVRHCASMPGSLRQGVDLMMVRECSEGFLSDRNMFKGSGEFMPSPDVALSVRVVTRQKCEQIARFAFEYARSQRRKRIMLAHKNVVFSLGCGLFRESVRACAADYPDIAVEEELVDTLAGYIVAAPEKYDVVLTTNLFGDILADVAAAQVGPMVPIVNASADMALFCPLHTPYNELAGKGRINPLGMLRAVSAMLHWLALPAPAARLDRALAKVQDAPLWQSLVLPDGLTTTELSRRVAQSILSG